MNRTYCLFSCSFSPSYYISQYYGCYSLAGCPLPYVAGTTLFFLFSSLYCFYAIDDDDDDDDDDDGDDDDDDDDDDVMMMIYLVEKGWSRHFLVLEKMFGVLRI